MNSTEDSKTHKHVIVQNTLEIPLENMKEIDAEQQQAKPQNLISL